MNQPWDCDILLNLEYPKRFWHILFYDWKPYVLAYVMPGQGLYEALAP